MADVFISYANEDRARARQLANALAERGWSVWWDRKIIAGQTFDQEIERALDAAKSVVVLWSKNSVSSEWVKNEASHAAERGVLVPAVIDEIRPPLEFRRKQTADLVGWQEHTSHDGFVSLCAGISANAIPKSAPATPSLPKRAVRQNSSRKWIGLTVIIILAIGFGVYWRLPRTPEPLIEKKSAESVALADSVAGTYDGDVISDSQGASQSNVTVTLTKVGQRRVKVTSDYNRLDSHEVDLTKIGQMILSTSSTVVLSINLDEHPPGLNYNPGGVAYAGKKR
ncbi:MAG: toll/interleukin-1 receptor domain-containing protein [Candidatus Binatia bacterium]